MEIRWHRKNSFTIKEGKLQVLIDPNETQQQALTEDDVVITTNFSISKSPARVFDWPGEFETKGVLIYSLATNFGSDETRILALEVEGIRICNLSEIRETLTDQQISELGNVDVLIIPLTLKTKDLVEMIEEIDPKMVIISMINEPETTLLADLLKEVGQSGLEEVDKVVIKQKSDIDSDQVVYKLLAVSE